MVSEADEQAAVREAERRAAIEVLTSVRPEGGAGVAPDTILLRGAAAARAKPIDLVARPVEESPPDIHAVGPWAQQLTEAREQACREGFEAGRREGHAKGLADGMADGRLALETQLTESEARIEAERLAMLASLSETVSALADQVDARLDAIGETATNSVVDLALEIAEAVLAREVAVLEDPGADAIARCLELAPAFGDLVAYLNPEDAERLGAIDGLDGRRLVVKPDPTLETGDAIVTVDEAVIDARLSESLQRVAEALR